MPMSDKKKCATLINVCAAEVVRLQAIATRLQAYRAAFQAQNVQATRTPLEGYIAAIASWTANVQAVADNAVANGLLIHRVPTHRDKALGEVE